MDNASQKSNFLFKCSQRQTSNQPKLLINEKSFYSSPKLDHTLKLHELDKNRF